MTVVVTTTNHTEIRVTRGESWAVVPHCGIPTLDILDGKGETVATFIQWSGVGYPADERGSGNRDEIVVRVHLDHIRHGLAASGPFSGAESDRAIVRRVREQVADAAEREAWKRLVADD